MQYAILTIGANVYLDCKCNKMMVKMRALFEICKMYYGSWVATTELCSLGAALGMCAVSKQDQSWFDPLCGWLTSLVALVLNSPTLWSSLSSSFLGLSVSSSSPCLFTSVSSVSSVSVIWLNALVDHYSEWVTFWLTEWIWFVLCLGLTLSCVEVMRLTWGYWG